MNRFIYALVLTAPLLADVKLDVLMPQDIQQQTGVANLNAQQKSALETWIDQNFLPKPKERKAGLSLALNINDGRKLLLSDHSLYEVAPSDITIAAAWLSPIEIRIEASSNSTYPDKLVNVDTGASVSARCLTPGTP